MDNGQVLADHAYWTDYWANANWVYGEVTPDWPLASELLALARAYNLHTSIEIGGFPGHYSILLYKHTGMQATLLDFVMPQNVLQQVCATNDVPLAALSLIETDWLAHQTEVQYDLVFSLGLLEHFADPAVHFAHHLPYLAPGGILYCTVPNFTGLNGWIQRRWDPAHQTSINATPILPADLQQWAKACGLTVLQAGYTGRFDVWLDRMDQLHWLPYLVVRSLRLFGKLYRKMIRRETRWFSPHVRLVARKPAVKQAA